ncbi:tyrosine--tRNA ligase [Patescibacteria group bacterium]|nr:tyrosine--tRNA ligase [Patescibacteria group bacterium]
MSDTTQIKQVLTRGVEQILPDVDSLVKLMSERKIRVYLGIDPTGNELTLGHSVVLRKLQQFADLGHEVILLIGNGTVKIGDPTGKDSTRPELSDAEIEENFKNWQSQASQVLDFEKITIRRNGDWLDQLKLPELIKIMAKSTVGQLLERDMFQDRLAKNQPIHTHELIYPLLQGYDSVVMDVDLEIGGNDQLFNMMMGRHLLAVYKQKPKWVLTTPIINGLDGRKMSKSYHNYVALTENPQDMYGQLMSTSDDQIIPYFETLTNVPASDIEDMQKKMQAGQNPMEFKKRLALTITGQYHSSPEATKAEANFESTVQNSQIPTDIPTVQVKSQTPMLEVLKAGAPDLSSNQLRRLVTEGAVEFFPSHQKPTDINRPVDLSQVKTIRIGKRRYFNLIEK